MSGPLGPVDPSFRALFGRLMLTVRRRKLKIDSFSEEVPFGGRSRGRSTRRPADEYQIHSVRLSTPPQNRQFDILISNTEILI